jgi:hypothetical protein
MTTCLLSANSREKIPIRRLSDNVILRCQPKNLEILHAAQDDNYSLRGACPERLDLSSSTGLAEGLRMTRRPLREVVGQPLRGDIKEGIIIALASDSATDN